MLAQEKLDSLLDRFSTIEMGMSENPDPETYVRLSREYAELQPVIEKIRALERAPQ